MVQMGPVIHALVKCLAVCHIDHLTMHRPTLLAQPLHLFGQGMGLHVQHQNTGTLLGQYLRNGQTQAASCTRDERHLIM